MHSLAIGKTLRKAPLFAHRTDQRDQFDHDQRRREATQGVRAVEASRDEQERQTRHEAQNEAEEILPPTFCQGGEVFVRFFRCHPAGPCSARSGRDKRSETTSRGAPPVSKLCTASTMGIATPRCSASSTSTGAVWAPSATVRRSAIRVSALLPSPSALPSEKLRLEVDEQVNTRSPKPHNPAKVSARAPSASPKRSISA